MEWRLPCLLPPSRCHISAMYRPSLGYVSAVSRLCLGCVSAMSRLCRGCVSAVSRLCLHLVGQLDAHKAVEAARPGEGGVEDVVPVRCEQRLFTPTAVNRRGRGCRTWQAEWRVSDMSRKGLGHVSEGARKGAGSRVVAPVGSADDDDIPRLPPEPIHASEHLVERLLDLLSVTEFTLL